MERDPNHDRIINAALHAAKRVHALAADRARAHDHRDAEALEAAAKALVAIALVHDVDPDLIGRFKGKAAGQAWIGALLNAHHRDILINLGEGKPA